jgi:hypothetical protein
MNVANLELCKELHQISGWADLPPEQWYGYEAPTFTLPTTVGYIPAYDLGYLLRKLKPIFLSQDDADLAKALRLMCQVKSPEDSLCKLAIELFRQNILTKEDK